SEREVSEVMRQAASNHLDNVRRARDSNSKIFPVELLDDGFDTVNESFAMFRMDERDDVAGFLILGNQEPPPEGTLLGVAKILRTIRQTAHACHGIDGFNLFGQLLQAIEVACGGNVRGGDAQDELAAGGKPLFDLFRFLKLWVAGGKEEVLIHVRLQID